MKPDFFNGFSKNTQTHNFEQICPVGAELFQSEGQTDTPKLMVASRHFANRPENEVQLLKSVVLFLPIIKHEKTSMPCIDISKIKLCSSYIEVTEFCVDSLRELLVYTKF